MSLEPNIKKEDEENNLPLTPNNFTEENIQKETNNKLQNKNDN